MIVSAETATSLRRAVPVRNHKGGSTGQKTPDWRDNASVAYWVDPGTDHLYPTSYHAYRRTRESEEKSPPRHRTLGSDVDHCVWQRGVRQVAPEVEVLLTLRPDTPPRIRRIVAEVLRAIRRGDRAGDAILRVSRQFGLRKSRTREFITTCIGFEIAPRRVVLSPASPRPLGCQAFPCRLKGARLSRAGTTSVT